MTLRFTARYVALRRLMPRAQWFNVHTLCILGHDEGAEFSIYDDVEEPEDDDEWIQYDSQLKEFRKTLDDKHLCVHVDIPAPSFATYCIIYNLSVGSNTKDQEKKECPHWTVWGPTLLKSMALLRRTCN